MLVLHWSYEPSPHAPSELRRSRLVELSTLVRPPQLRLCPPEPGRRVMEYFEALAQQPDALRRSREVVLGQLSKLSVGPESLDRVVACGLGASYNAALAARPFWDHVGIALEIRSPSELTGVRRPSPTEVIVAISQSGRSAEILELLEDLPNRAVLLTEDPTSPAARTAGVVVDLGLLGDSGVRTIGYSATVQALHLLAETWSGATPGVGSAGDELASVAGRVETCAAALHRTLASVVEVDLVGTVDTLGPAAQGALLLRECARMPAAFFETRQYLHGPVEAAGPETGVLLLGGDRELRLASSLAAERVPVGLLSTSPELASMDGSLESFAMVLAGVPLPARTIVLTAVLQHLAGLVARARDLTPGEFVHSQDDTKVLT